jgi:hypothetical protein
VSALEKDILDCWVGVFVVEVKVLLCEVCGNWSLELEIVLRLKRGVSLDVVMTWGLEGAVRRRSESLVLGFMVYGCSFVYLWRDIYE